MLKIIGIKDVIAFVIHGIVIGTLVKLIVNIPVFHFKRNKKYLRMSLKAKKNYTRKEIIEIGKKALYCPLSNSIYYI